MFKASIALVLIAFGALAYGWLSNDDTILYASIGASILAGLFLLRATMADRKAGYAPEPKASRPERPAREPRERKPQRGESAAPAARQRRSKGMDSDERTRQMEMPDYDDDSEGDEPLSALRPRSRRDRLPAAPAGAAWAEAEQGYDDTEFEEEDRGIGPPSYDADYGDEDYDDDYAPPAAQAQGAAADDFRSRLAAVLGSSGEEATPPAPQPERERARRVTPGVPEYDEPPPAPKRRGRRKPEPYLEPGMEAEYEDSSEEAEPDWVRIEDVPSISRPAPTDEMIHYRPRRPEVAAAPEGDEQDEPESPPAPRSRGGASQVRPVGAKRPPAPRSSGVTRVSPAEKTTKARAAKPQDPDAPPPRRGRPPRPKP